MQEKVKTEALPDHPREDPRHRARIPGFNVDTDIGLGDLIKRATAAAGVKPCASCLERAGQLNQWLHFTGRRVGQ